MEKQMVLIKGFLDARCCGLALPAHIALAFAFFMRCDLPHSLRRRG